MLKSQQILQKRYQLKEQLSQNPTRQTWLAEDTQSHQQVIVKLLPFSPQTQWQDVKLFEREAQILKYLNFAEIPRYLDYFSIEKELGDGLPWFALVQNYIPGSSLQQLLKQGKQFTEPIVKDIAKQLLEILIHLHELSPPVLHRDIKPSNIIQGQDGKIHLVDFGAVQDKAKVEGLTFTVVGTGGYAPPEQLWGRAVAASDLYALGATLIHLLTGVAPGELPQHRMRLQFREKANVSPEFAAWLDKLIEPAVERRYGSAREALAALQETEREKAGAKVRLGRLGDVALLQYGTLGLCLLALPLFTVYRYISEGKNEVRAMNRAQQAYFLENNEFASTFQKLDVGIRQSTQNYTYETMKTPLYAINYALPRQHKIKVYVGIVPLITTPPGELKTGNLLCEAHPKFSLSLKKRMMDLPWIDGEVLRCPSWTKTVGETSEITVQKEGLMVSYPALKEVRSSRDDTNYLSRIGEISNPEAKVRALETIAPTLTTERQFERTLKLVETIEKQEAKGKLLLELARKFYFAAKPERAAKIRSHAFEILQPIALHRNDDYKLWLIQATVSGLRTQEQVQEAMRLLRSLAGNEDKQDGKHEYRQNQYREEIVKTIAASSSSQAQQEIALQIANDLSSTANGEVTLHSALSQIVPNLKTSEQIDRALDFVPTLTKDYFKSSFLTQLAAHLKTSQQLDRTLTLTEKLVDDEQKADVLEKLPPHLKTSQQIDRTLTLTEKLVDDNYRSRVLKKLVPYLKTSQQIDRARALIQQLAPKSLENS